MRSDPPSSGTDRIWRKSETSLPAGRFEISNLKFEIPATSSPIQADLLS